MAFRAPLVVPALRKHTATVIVNHGLGDSGAGWVFLAENWRRQGKFDEVSFVFPNAPSIPVTVNMGMSMPAWYDITGFDDITNREDEPGVLRAQKYMHSLIQAETTEKGIPSSRIVLGGFSQGGAISLFSGITCPQKLGGIFGLSTYMLLRGKAKDMIPADNPNKETRIFMGHGDADPVVRYGWGQRTAEELKEWGFQVEFRTYPNLVHSPDPQEIDDLERYLVQQIPPLGDAAAAEDEGGKLA